jgi:hypothetical protein
VRLVGAWNWMMESQEVMENRGIDSTDGGIKSGCLVSPFLYSHL